MAATELRERRQVSRRSALVTYVVNRGIDTALDDPALPDYGDARLFDGRNLVVVGREPQAISPDACYVFINYGPPSEAIGGEIEPSEPNYTDIGLSFTSEDLEIPYFEPLPAVTESGTPYSQWVYRPRIVPRPVVLLEAIVNILSPGPDEFNAVLSQTGKIHTIGGAANWFFEGGEWSRISVTHWECTYSWRGSLQYTPTEVPGLLSPTDPLPPHAIYQTIRGSVSGSGGDQIEGPPTFYINNLYDLGDVSALPGNVLGALS